MKGARTAIGLSSSPISTYLTPDFTIAPHPSYLSMGGAGFIYPSKNRARRGYAEGDVVKVNLRDQIDMSLCYQTIHVEVGGN